MKNIFLLYVIDQWHTHKSKEVIGIASNMDAVCTLAKKSGYPLTDNDLLSLRVNNQTNGLQNNLLVENWEVHK